ncbi:carbohydrate-binding protein [Nocardia sp. CDC153]|uniref:carbohydrate-binding protein n=1 Tax=Nocardia sp. CDC153 TaxID=3112167 RepID=UPI002DBAC5F8|nr:carbohydrate-binding protein [Nocardia sp. CDC153]MEC3957620.1 carbohydrate-binding protein [Nocardia sp. CDC153]
MGIAGLAVLAAAPVLGVHTASADITGTGITVQGTTFQVGQSYQVCAKQDLFRLVSGPRVTLYDGTQSLGFQVFDTYNWPADGVTFCLQWTPAAVGTVNMHAEFTWNSTDPMGDIIPNTADTATVAVPVTATTPSTTTPPPTTTTVPPTTTTVPPTTTTTVPPTTTTTPVAEWQQNATYKVGDVVTYDGVQYRCIQAHTAYAPNWTPPLTPALWQRL